LSVYQVQQCMFDYLRATESAGRDAAPPTVRIDGYDLTPREAEALVEGRVSDLYAMGVHPVLINGYCRANGWKRADYRALFAAGGADPAVAGFSGRPRWQTS
jgi:hypothetical protein